MIIRYNKQYVDKSDIKEVEKALKSEFITTGPYVRKLEGTFKKYFNTKHVLACSSGTTALYISMRALNIKKDDIVIMPSINFVAATNVAALLGAKIFLCDVDSKTGQITPNKLSECIKINKLKKIKLIITMYLGGAPLNVAELFKFKKKYNCFLIEDSCHALGASYKFKNRIIKVGSSLHTDISTFSLHPTKSITSGEGGLITTRSRTIYEKLRLIRSHGIQRNKNKYWEPEVLLPSLNFRISDINAALALSQFKKLSKFINKRKKISNIYYKNLNDYKKVVRVSKLPKDVNSSCHLQLLIINFKKLLISKNQFIKKLNKNNIFPQYHYMPIYKFLFYKNLKRNQSFKDSEQYYKSVLSFPIYYSLEKKSLTKIFNTVKKMINNHLK
jgi:dTDP-4-amino-4,6-dideoxygalactose transaminase